MYSQAEPGNEDHMAFGLIVSFSAHGRITQFLIWATRILKGYIINDFAMDGDRLKNGRYFGQDYFREPQSALPCPLKKREGKKMLLPLFNINSDV